MTVRHLHEIGTDMVLLTPGRKVENSDFFFGTTSFPVSSGWFG